MNLNIGILSLYCNNSNYGGLLQAYALEEAVKSLGHSSEQISYDPSIERGMDQIKFSFKKSVRQLFPGFRFYNSKYEKSVRRFGKKIPHSKRVYLRDRKKLNSIYDAFICGSDQIWNPIGWTSTFFLDFATKPKISYAASIARDSLSKEEVEFIAKHTSNFSSLSVREQNSSIFLSNTLKRDFELVPDPTLLLSKEEWNSKIPNKIDNSSKRPYVFAYFLGYNSKQRFDCIEFAKAKGLDILFIPFMKRESYNWDKENSKYVVRNFEVENFVNLIRNAELILTDSFHGAVFSCIFEKPFYVLDRQLIGKEKSMNSRFNTLFNQLGINNSRMIDDILSVDKFNFSDEELDVIVKSKKRCKQIGMDYLTKSLRKVEKNEKTR